VKYLRKFDIAENRFLAKNSPISFVAGLRRLQLTDPLAAFDGPTSNRWEGRGGEKRGEKGKENATHPLSKILSCASYSIQPSSNASCYMQLLEEMYISLYVANTASLNITSCGF